MVVGSQLPSSATCILRTYNTNIHVLVVEYIMIKMALEIHVRTYEISIHEITMEVLSYGTHPSMKGITPRIYDH